LAALPVTGTRAAAHLEVRRLEVHHLEVRRLEVLGHRLKGLLGRPDSARHIAATYLDGSGQTDWRRAAVDLDIPAVFAPMHRIAGTTASRAWLGSRIRADFEAGAIIGVDGWRLSRTEVGACLLVAGVA
jgi:hypothetical protein